MERPSPHPTLPARNACVVRAVCSASGRHAPRRCVDTRDRRAAALCVMVGGDVVVVLVDNMESYDCYQVHPDSAVIATAAVTVMATTTYTLTLLLLLLLL